MYCDDCKKNIATVHLTRIINGQKEEIHLCDECARKREDIDAFIPFSINDLLSSFLDVDEGQKQIQYSTKSVLKCKRCGMTYDQFKKIGRLGCSNCYNAFKNELAPVLRRVHGSLQHSGKVPKKAGADLINKREIDRLKSELKDAISQEAFEKAAELRDRIKELESSNEQRGE